ncbi:MAG: lipid A export permease/ATP-binding protein MsbA [Deltaproteobacteria bacterium]|nr:MAG: lipid A export permease/ATP-binding protein MsbA [Deltaproteobacteria bacterium]
MDFDKMLRKRHRHLIRLVRENLTRLVLALLCSLMVAASTAISAFLMKNVIDDIFIEKKVVMLKLLPPAVVIIYLVRGIGMYGQKYMMNYVGESIIRRLRNMLYERIMDLPLAFFQEKKTGVLMSRITNDVNVIKSMVSTAVTGSFRDIFSIIGLTGVIFYRDWKMALIAFVVFPVALYPLIFLGRKVRNVSTGCQEAMADLNTFLHETFTGNKIVKAFGMEPYEKKRFFKINSNFFHFEMRSVIARSLSSPIMEFLGGVGIAFIIWYGGFKVLNGSSTPGTFFSFITAVLLLYDPAKKLSTVNNSVQQGLAAVDRVFDILETESEIREPSDPVVIASRPHRVRFENVSFSYGEKSVLKDINLDVKNGEVLALVGMSGGGKTSMVNLIPRFYDVDRGCIYIDDIDIRKASITSLRKQIAIVTQEPILFNDTVRNNIAYGRPDASDEKIKAAAEAAYAYNFIKNFPRQFDTPIGELGGRLSGGEKQRICIARALLKDAPILILDEATSSLDTEAESVVQKALENLMKGRTTFVIAHRLSTIAYAHRIIVLKDGKIVEQGRHTELLDYKGEYYKLYQMQFANGKAADC